jgi:hypothetical protein
MTNAELGLRRGDCTTSRKLEASLSGGHRAGLASLMLAALRAHDLSVTGDVSACDRIHRCALNDEFRIALPCSWKKCLITDWPLVRTTTVATTNVPRKLQCCRGGHDEAPLSQSMSNGNPRVGIFVVVRFYHTSLSMANAPRLPCSVTP